MAIRVAARRLAVPGRENLMLEFSAQTVRNN